MQMFESLFLCCLIALLATVQKPTWLPAAQVLLLASLALCLLNGVFEIWRWPLVPAYVGFALVAWFVITHVKAPAGASLYLTLTAALPVGLSFLLLKGLPVAPLPAPAGAFPVGVTELFLQDASRMEAFGGSAPAPRALYVKVWYPGMPDQSTQNGAASGLWEEIATQEQFKPLNLFLGFLTRIKTHGFRQLAPASGYGRFPVLLYNHAIVSYPSENTLLMEHLASHGYVIFSISHVNQMEAFRSMPAQEGSSTEAVLQRIDTAAEPREKAAIGLAYYEAASATNALVASRVLDSAYLLRVLTEQQTLPKHLQALVPILDLSLIGALGHSLGGAVSVELCKTSGRCGAVANLDGGAFGYSQGLALQIPCLRLSNALTADMNEHQRLTTQSAYYDYVFQRTRHGDFSDQGMVLPIYRWFGLLGKADAREVLAWKNALVLGFFEHTLKRSADISVLTPRTELIVSRMQVPTSTALP
jgi:predicted dienelactone hydrolase